MEHRVRPTGRWALAWRVGVALLGIGLLLNGSVRMSDDVWPFGPLSQYAFAPSATTVIQVTRVEGLLVDGRRIDLPLRVGESGISRAEIEARIPDIKRDPSLLRSVAEGWSSRHPGQPELEQVWLVQDETTLGQSRSTPARLVELVTWVVPR